MVKKRRVLCLYLVWECNEMMCCRYSEGVMLWDVVVQGRVDVEGRKRRWSRWGVAWDWGRRCVGCSGGRVVG